MLLKLTRVIQSIRIAIFTFSIIWRSGVALINSSTKFGWYLPLSIFPRKTLPQRWPIFVPALSPNFWFWYTHDLSKFWIFFTELDKETKKWWQEMPECLWKNKQFAETKKVTVDGSFPGIVLVLKLQGR